MRKTIKSATVVICMVGLVISGFAQRKMENLGRGVVAIYKGSNQVYVSWRLLGSDPNDIAFNLYRATNSGTPVKLNGSPIMATTDYTDNGVDITQSNAYSVKPVINNIEQAASASFTIPANAVATPYIKIPLQPCPEGGFYIHLAWTGDLDGDGEYDYVVDRLPLAGTIGTIKLDAYKSDGTFLWRIDLGPNSTISTGHNDGVTVYDLDGDGKAEVVVRTSLGTVFADNNASNGEYISVVNGETGTELARTAIQGGGHMGIAYLDGVNPSVVFEYKPTSDYFDLHIRAYDYKSGVIIQKPWEWVMPPAHDHHAFHQIRIMDVDLDGKDEICQGGFVVDDNGQSLYKNECVHGDRFHITDFDPDRPGLEFFSIQQDNPRLLNTLYFDAATGKPIKRHIGTVLSDVGRGSAGDIDPASPGVEYWSTQQGMYNKNGEMIYTNRPAGNPNFSIWWDGDLLREHLYETKIDKWNYTTKSSARLLTAYQTGATETWRNAPPMYGDLFGDWREEVMFEDNTHVQLQIYTTTIPASTRMYTLMHNPGYRNAMCARGYYQTNHPDFFVGAGMDKPPLAPIFTGDMVWKGDQGNNLWDEATQNWQLNGTPNTFGTGKKVLFDIAGTSAMPVDISTTLQPGEVIVNAPTNYTFQGAGKLSGSMSLTKTGWGALTLDNNNDYTGNTVVDAGTLIVNGVLSESKVTVESKGKIGGAGKLLNGLTLNRRASLLPGNGTAGADTLHVSGNVVISGKNTLHFDLSDDPTATVKPNDMIDITGNLTITGANIIEISLIDGALAAGNYTLVKYAGTLTGDLSGFSVKGIEGLKYSLSLNANNVVLTIAATRSPASVVWKGTAGNNWDIGQTLNFTKASVADVFAPGDNVLFDNTSSQKGIILVSSLKPAAVVVDASADYSFSGSGSITGNAGITKTGTGKLSVFAKNTYTGPTIINGGTLQIDSVSNGGEPGPLGAATAASTNFTLNGGTLQYTGGTSNTDKGITLGAGNATIEVVNSATNLAVTGQITGNGQLIKTGPGMLTFVNANSYTGGTVLKEGKLNLGSYQATEGGTGTGTLTLEGGELWIFDTYNGDLDGVWYPVPQNIVIPAGKTTRINASGRSIMTGTLTGSGELTFYVPFIRTELNGNWSAFAGKIYVIADGDGGDFRINNSNGYANTSLNLGDKVAAYHKTSGAQSVAIGELSGTATAVLTGENWTIGGKSTNAIFNGVITGNSITKVGTGSWTLTNASTYTGATNINGGALVVKNATGSATGTGAVTVRNTAKLGGTGIISGAVTVVSGATIAPGDNGIGTLAINNNLALAAGSTSIMEVQKGPLASDTLRLTGSVTYGGTLSITKLSTASFAAGDNFRLFKAASYKGKFSAIIPDSPGSTLYWDTTQLRVDGTVSVRGKQLIAFDVPATIKNIDPDYKLGATVNSGLTIQYASSNPQIATIVIKQGSAYLHAVAPGTATITASQPGGDGWDAATPVAREVNVEVVTGVEELQKHGIHIYPNPFTDKLHIALPQASSTGVIYVYSAAGQLLHETRATGNLTINDLLHFVAGAYTIKIVLPDSTFTAHIVKTH